MRDVSLWAGLLGVAKAVIERVEFDEDAVVLVAHVRPTNRQRGREIRCQLELRRRASGPDAGVIQRTCAACSGDVAQTYPRWGSSHQQGEPFAR